MGPRGLEISGQTTEAPSEAQATPAQLPAGSGGLGEGRSAVHADLLPEGAGQQPSPGAIRDAPGEPVLHGDRADVPRYRGRRGRLLS